MKILSEVRKKKSQKALGFQQGFRFHTFIGRFQVTAWQWRVKTVGYPHPNNETYINISINDNLLQKHFPSFIFILSAGIWWVPQPLLMSPVPQGKENVSLILIFIQNGGSFFSDIFHRLSPFTVNSGWQPGHVKNRTSQSIVSPAT